MALLASASKPRDARSARREVSAWADVKRALMRAVLLVAATVATAAAQEPLKLVIPTPADQISTFITLARTDDGIIYAGGFAGMSRYNGTRWETVGPKGPVRALHYDNGRIWAGGYNTFGYVVREPTGQDRYVDLAPLFSGVLKGRNFADTWRMLVRPEGVYFVALRDLFFVSRDERTTRHWPHDGRFGAITEWDGAVVVQWRGEGLKRLRQQGNQFELIPGTEVIANDLIFSAIDQDEGRKLLNTATGKLYWLLAPPPASGVAGPVVPATGVPGRKDVTPASYFLGTRVSGNEIAYVSFDGVLRVLDTKAWRQTNIPISTGYIGTAYVDPVERTLWAPAENGITLMNWPTVWTAYGLGAGVRGSVKTIREINGRLWVATGADILRARLPLAAGGAQQFESAASVSGEVWDVALEPDGRGVIVAESYGIAHLDDARNGRLAHFTPADVYPRLFVRSGRDRAVMWVGTEHGVVQLKAQGGRWALATRFARPATRVDSMHEQDDGTLLLGTTKGAFLLNPAVAVESAYVHVPLPNPQGARKVEASDANDAVLFSMFEGRLIASAPTGFFAWRAGRLEAIDSAREFAGLEPSNRRDERVQFVAQPNPTGDRQPIWWAVSDGAVHRLRRPAVSEGGGARAWMSAEVTSLRRGEFSYPFVASDGSLWLGSSGQLFRHAETVEAANRRVPVLRLDRAERTDADGSVKLLNLTGAARIDGNVRTLGFSLAFDDHARAKRPMFEVRLNGHEADFSAASEQSAFRYSGLGPGRYRFEARTRDRDGVLRSLAPFELEILPRWYQSPITQLVAGAAALLLIVWLTRRYYRGRTRRLQMRNHELNDLVTARTSELQAANARLTELAGKDGLTGTANRRYFDEALVAAVCDAADEGRPLTLLIADLDHFKNFNDTKGHLAGDDLLRRVGGILMAEANRMNALCARYGGEEFALVIAGREMAEGIASAERIRAGVAALAEGVTISIGVAHGKVHPDAARRLIATADAALYLAKHQGRNRIESAVHEDRIEPRTAPKDGE